MSEPNDMERPVTKRELTDELGKLEAKLDAKLSKYATKDDLKRSFEAWGAILESRITNRLMLELKQHTKVILESLQGQVSTFDDRYKDLPPRVTKLENKVFAPNRTRRKR